MSTARTTELFSGDPSDPAQVPAFQDALVAGWSAGFLVAAAFLYLAAVLMQVLVRVSQEHAAAVPA